MKTALRRILAVALCVVTVFSLSVAAFAKDSEPIYPHFDSIFSIGDSTCMGYGLKPGYKNWNDPETYIHSVEGSYTNTVAKALLGEENLENCDMLAYPALRSKDSLKFLGVSDIEPDPYFQGRFKGCKQYIVRDSIDYTTAAPASFEAWDGEIGTVFEDKLQKDDNKLVLLYSGAADVIYSTSYFMHFDLDDIPNSVERLIGLLWENYGEFLEYYPALCQRIRELNPDCTLVMLGTFNPLRDVVISDELLIPLGNAFALLTDTMNEQIRAWTKDFDGIYVDVSNTETKTLDQQFSASYVFGGGDTELVYHPNQAGYDYMARQILKALENKKGFTTNIRVDLGGVKKVTGVMVNGLPVLSAKYDAETHILTVPSVTTKASSMVVTELREDGSLYLATYRLSFNKKAGGYTAYRLYATRNVWELFTGAYHIVESVCQKTISSIAKILSK